MQSKHLCIIEAVASVLFADLENGEPDLLLRRTSLSLYTCNRVRIFFFPMQSLSFLFQRYLRMLVLCFPPPAIGIKIIFLSRERLLGPLLIKTRLFLHTCIKLYICFNYMQGHVCDMSPHHQATLFGCTNMETEDQQLHFDGNFGPAIKDNKDSKLCLQQAILSCITQIQQHE
ncbi:uncharacterized protein LOC105436063 isoform X2 [Cucumis sativus]|uniref:uncharacterized protein LOC105436063 isoform X2 n=1 Tax=Cucumis sativus TaxID=3659 RepID=UPI0012F4A438|nr:uncharacterized protein LOC105436063 isoform X2 [Cucumis sativus]